MKSYRITERVGKVEPIYHFFEIGEIVHEEALDEPPINGSLRLTNGTMGQWVQPDCVEEVKMYKVVGNEPRQHHFPIGTIVSGASLGGDLLSCHNRELDLWQFCSANNLEEVNQCSE